MILFPNAKINIGLNITEKRPDGYHNLETVFFPVEMSDALEVLPADNPDTRTDIVMHTYGLTIDGHTDNNLVVRAYRLLRERFALPPVEVHLQKNISMGAGLGGGSSDAAFMLVALNRMFHLELTDNELQSYAAKLGADCPFFILNHPTLASGIGNIFKPTKLDLSNYRIEIVKPDIHVSTAEAYRGCVPHRWGIPLATLIDLPVEQWRGLIVNDFETSVFAAHPELAAVKESMYSKGAVYASMSGSGSAIYGIFKK